MASPLTSKKRVVVPAALKAIGFTAEERQKGWRPSAGVAFRARDFDRALVSTLAASGSFERVRIMETGTLSEAYAQQGWLLDGFPRTQEQAIALRDARGRAV